MSEIMSEDVLVLGLGDLDLSEAVSLTRLVGQMAYAVKIHALYDKEGRDGVQMLLDNGARRVFVDAKIHDTPRSAAMRAKAIGQSGAGILTVHASGGEEMMRAAKENFAGEVYGVTVLTSTGDGVVTPRLHYLAAKILASGLDGVVCGVPDIAGLFLPSHKIKIVVPGTRLPGASHNGQVRSGTIQEALIDGAHHIVVESEIIHSSNPVRSFRNMYKIVDKTLSRM